MPTPATADSARLADPVFARRYRAIESRDARFDGQFITGVRTTGIYCRPSCPALTPRPANVDFFLTAAAAHEAGFRACKRCLPDAVPGSPQWNLRDDLAARAMRLISDGVVEREGVPGLARRLGYTPRHLGRVLTQELGAGPLALARAHRAHTARLLLTETDLPITEVAFAAGFASVRTFNETIAEVYRVTPGGVRRSARRGTRPSSAAERRTRLQLRLPARTPFDAAGVLTFLGDRAIPGVESLSADGYARSLRLPHGSGIVRLRADGGDGAECELVLDDIADLAPAVERVRRLLDLDADAEAIDDALGRDDALAAAIATVPGMRLPGSVDAHETLFRALLGQQVSVAGARTALGRLAAAVGEPLSGGGDHAVTRLFPTAAAIAEHGRELLRGPASRIETVVRVATELATGSLEVGVGESREELTARLTAIPGIGDWTAGYVAMRVLGSPDVLLTGDLALRQGAARLGLPATPRLLAERARVWSPWRSYAGMHLWRAARRG